MVGQKQSAWFKYTNKPISTASLASTIVWFLATCVRIPFVFIASDLRRWYQFIKQQSSQLNSRGFLQISGRSMHEPRRNDAKLGDRNWDHVFSVRPFRHDLFRCRTFSAQVVSAPIRSSLTVHLFGVRALG